MTHSIGLSAELISYLAACNPPEHPELARCRLDTLRDYPENAWFQISPEQGAFMQFLARLIRPRRGIEIGVFTGYSILALALVMREIHGEEALLVGCDSSPEWSQVAHAHWRAAGVDSIVDLRVGPALDTLADLIRDELESTFDYAFIDADKKNTPAYYDYCIRLLRPGGVLIIDNVLWAGAVTDPAVDDADTAALREVAQIARRDDRVRSMMCGVGDGLLFCMKIEGAEG